ncbi:MAG: NAD(P)-dependent oxidoreductase [Rhodobacteraceae bacterium]|nr:NAD(P)-dependent oxidoreductase [Paracoccaceae bacterium]
MTHIAFIGLGAMGSAMAHNLVQAAFTVTGFDLNKDALAALVRSGGQAADSAAAAARDADVLILMVVNMDQAKAVLFDQGALAALPAHASVCLMATCPPAAVRDLAKQVCATGRGFVDCPVSGGVAGARDASLTIMVGAPAPDLDAVRPVLAALGARIFHVGPNAGQGASVKAINQLLCGVQLVAAAEALALGEREGVDTNVLLDILQGSSASSWMLSDRGPRMLQDAPEVTSAVDIFVKDMTIALDAGRAAKMGLPLASVAMQLFAAESGAGGGRNDDSQVIRAYRRMNGF